MRASRPHVQQVEAAHDTRVDLEHGDLCDDVCAGFRFVAPDNQRIQRVCGLGRRRGRNGGSRFAIRLAAHARDGRRHAGNERPQGSWIRHSLGLVPERDSHSDAGATHVN